jgi:hypothetical protein
MARLFSRLDATAVDDPEFGHFDISKEHGGFDFPDDLSDRQRRFHHRGKPAWETEDERNRRLHGEESARRRDPESLYSAVEKIAGIADRMGGAPNPDVAALMARLAELEVKLAGAGGAKGADEPEADEAADGEQEGDGEGQDAPAKPARSRSKS